MCGIAGILLAPGKADPRRLAAVQAMAATLRHRGPDGSGIWLIAAPALLLVIVGWRSSICPRPATSRWSRMAAAWS